MNAIKLNQQPPQNQQGCGSGRVLHLNEPVKLATLIERIKGYLNLKHGNEGL